MANNNNHGPSGSKFVSVNLNKLYGQPSHHTYSPAARPRPAGGVHAGGGMVVLSRNRSLQKPTPKLSVPPPLNLPSLRKEFEKSDVSGAAGGVAGGGGSGSGSRPSSSGVGWTKPASVGLRDKEVVTDGLESVRNSESGGGKVRGAYMPPSARFAHGDTGSANYSNVALVPKAMVLRGEDFPSLRAALPSSTGSAQKQKEASFQKVRQLVSEESSNDLRNSSHFNSSHHDANGGSGTDVQSLRPSGARVDHGLKQEDPLPLIRLNPRFDWADDERDTGHGFIGRSGRDQELSKSEIYWDRDFDVPRSSVLPHKPINNLPERRSLPVAKSSNSEAVKTEPYREVNSWRSSSINRDKPISDRNNAHYGAVTENRDSAYVRRDAGQVRHWNQSIESPRYRNEGSKSGFSVGGRSTFSKGERGYLNDSSQKDFSSGVYDEVDPFTGNLFGVVKKKKDVINQTDFYDPVRESFEAELERVQKMQEMERQRIADEHERAIEQARREDEEMRRAILEEEERRRRLEEETREAAWIAEQERLDAIQKAEDQKLAREEERKRMDLEEERRKQAAKQKLLELEARMAKREAEVGKTGADDEVLVGGKDSDASMDSDIDNWEVNQRMVERITSAGSDSSAIDRPFDRFHSSKSVSPWKREAFEVGSNSSFLLNDQENGHHSGRSTYMSSRSHDTDGFPHVGDRDHRWNSFGDGNRDTEPEYFNNVGWGQGYFRNNTQSYSERLYMNVESDKIYSYGRSQYQMKQPRVLPPPPPPSLSVPRSSVRGENEISGPSSSLESTARTGNYGSLQDNLVQSDHVDFQQGLMAQNLENNETLRCDSQSSLSVSSPPSSPTHLSHDELDNSGEVKEVVNDESADLTTMETLKSVSTDEDEEWSLENHDEMQEQEEYDEDDDYGEEDEVRELPDDNINLTHEFDNMQLEEKDTTNVMENTVLGFNEGVEVKIPDDEFENDLKTEADTNTIDTPEVSVNVVEKQAAVDALINEQPQNVSTSSSHLGDPSLGQSTTPVKLQFGLFSGPTLIPSPVPSIQIGSIQMPLPLHPPVGSSLGHMHASQPPPLFQFGQLRYTSPVSQGILPVPQNIHHTHTLFNVNHNSATYLPYQFPQETSVINMKTDTGSSSSLNNQDNLSHADENVIASKPVTRLEEKGHETYNNDKNVPLSKAPGPLNKGKRNMYPARNSGPRSFQPYDSMGFNKRKHRRPIQRTEFRVRENVNSYDTGNFTRSGYRRQVGSNMKRAAHEAEIVSESRPVKETVKTKTQVGSSTVDSKKNVPEADVDAPLQSGVVHVYKQPGIECPSDEDDFIEVRSKRQMLNDRREQREKEIKAKSRVTKQPRRASVTSTRSNKISSSSLSEPSKKTRSDVTKKPSADFSTTASEALTPIDTPTVDDSKNLQRESSSAVSDAAEDHDSNLMFETETKVVDDVQTTLADWGNAQMEQQVIPLTQTQLDEAMKPARFSTINTTHVTSIGDHTTVVSEPVLSSSSMLTKGKAISSSSSPVNSLLAGEKIQFGAVTSPTILPPSTRAVSHGVGAPGLFRSDTSQNTQNVLKTENDCVTEVEDVVSSVDVAAINTNEIIGNGLGPISVSGPGGLSGKQQSGSQSKPEESLSVSLPADLSVETTPISLWTPLPSPQGSSTQMLSHFPGPAPSHFPFYDMNHPMMNGPVYAFGPHDESDGPNSQAQKPTGPSSRHIGAWQNQSGMDSFYGPAGFTGPFIGPPGVQAPPHMVVYNHYAPVGQFGQVGLSFMGTTYIPSGKQPDWKHDPTSSSRGEDISSINMASGPCNLPNMQPPVQHVGPSSPLLPMGPPMTMFDVPPFQTAPDMAVQARWSHVLASSLHPVPMSLPLQQQTEAITGPSQFSSHVGHPVDQSTFPPNRLSEPQSSNPSVAYPVIRDSTTTHFPDEFGLVDSSGPSSSATSAPVTVSHISSGTTKNNNNSGGSVEFKNQHQPVKTSSSQHYNNNHSGGYGYQRGGLGASPKNKPVGGQWVNRRPGFHGRYHHQQSMGTDKGFPSSTKVKQIYVAKQPGPGGSGSGSGSGSTMG